MKDHTFKAHPPQLASFKNSITCLLFQIPCSTSCNCQIFHVLLNVDIVLGPLSQLMQHSLILTTVERLLYLLYAEACF